MSKIAYIRVSTKEQNTARQYELLKERNIVPDKVYEEHISGKNTDRPELKAMLAYVREGDTVYIESISRLARNTRDFLNIVDLLQGKQVELVSLKESIDTATPTGKFMLSVFAALYQMERENALQRQRDQRGGRACQHGQKARHKGRDQQINRRDGQREQARARGLRQPAGRQAQQGNVQNAGSRRRPRRGVGFDSPLHVYPPGVLHRGLYNPFLF